MPLARIGLGANLGDPRATLERAILALGGLGTVTARSSTSAMPDLRNWVRMAASA